MNSTRLASLRILLAEIAASDPRAVLTPTLADTTVLARPDAPPPVTGTLGPVEFWPWRIDADAERDRRAGHMGAFGSSYANYRVKNRPDHKRAKRAEQKASRRRNRGR